MTDWGLGPFGQGFLFGLALAMPVGAIGLLCIRRSLEYGFATGFATGLGAAVADAGYGAVAAFGLTAVSDFLLAWQTVLALAGGAALIWLGVQSWRTRAQGPARTASVGPHPVMAFVQTVGLTLANPQTILTFVALFAGLGVVLGERAGWTPALLLILGVFLGSGVWWLILAGAVGGVLRRRLSDGAIGWINCGAGALIVGFGLLAVARGLGLI
ncbi:LysE family translocator [Thalassobaculum litoreum]|uniref:Threonine/homoserine/homoserine lactone efflux protein n=1 Tax=Thalassobaculum litoreum DSM 18839 TaxID=1123362 RepID=A0A8G2BNS7_9PROT|nr:LysE family translocator [Thalassobaculum litoreum]SDG49494.1 Threonine/homoserine/homoserine lactone efflux protein [Thalassobaculum litoreum DSM 18839]